MFSLLGTAKEDVKTDFEKDSKPVKTKKISFNSREQIVKLKLIGRGITYDIDTANVSYDFKIIIPNVELKKNLDFGLSVGESYSPSYEFNILEFNDDGDLFEIEFTERIK